MVAVVLARIQQNQQYVNVRSCQPRSCITQFMLSPGGTLLQFPELRTHKSNDSKSSTKTINRQGLTAALLTAPPPPLNPPPHQPLNLTKPSQPLPPSHPASTLNSIYVSKCLEQSPLARPVSPLPQCPDTWLVANGEDGSSLWGPEGFVPEDGI